MSDKELGKALMRILESAPFKRTTHSRNILRYLFQAYEGGESDSLKEYSIGVDVMKKGVDYDPQTDTVVRVEMNRLRSRLASYYRSEGKEEQWKISIPKGAYKLEISKDTSQGGQDQLQSEFPEHLYRNFAPVYLKLNIEQLNNSGIPQGEMLSQILIDCCRKLKFCKTELVRGGENPEMDGSDSLDVNSQPDFSLLASVYAAGSLTILFLSLLDWEKNYILISRRIVLDPESWEEVEQKVTHSFQELKETLDPFGSYYRNKLILKSEVKSGFWDAHNLLRSQDIQDNSFALERALKILEGLYRKNSRDPVVRAELIGALIREDMLWCRLDPRLETLIDDFLKDFSRMSIFHPLILDGLQHIYLYREDLVSLRKTLELQEESPTDDPVIRCRRASVLYRLGERETALELLNWQIRSQDILPNEWVILPAVDSLNQGDFSAFRDWIRRMKTSSMPRNLLLKVMAAKMAPEEQEAPSLFLMDMVRKGLRGRDPLPYLCRSLGAPGLISLFQKYLEIF